MILLAGITQSESGTRALKTILKGLFLLRFRHEAFIICTTHDDFSRRADIRNRLWRLLLIVEYTECSFHQNDFRVV